MFREKLGTARRRLLVIVAALMAVFWLGRPAHWRQKMTRKMAMNTLLQTAAR